MNPARARASIIDYVVLVLALVGMICLLSPMTTGIVALYSFRELGIDSHVGALFERQQLSLHQVVPVSIGCMMLSALLLTIAHHRLRNPAMLPVMLLQWFAVLLGIGFIASQVIRYSQFHFVDQSLIFHMVMTAMSYHGLILLFGLVLLGASVLIGYMKGPCLANEAAIWHWHALDSVWAVLIYVAVVTGNLPYL